MFCDQGEILRRVSKLKLLSQKPQYSYDVDSVCGNALVLTHVSCSVKEGIGTDAL
jgi:hypothetical protein